MQTNSSRHPFRRAFRLGHQLSAIVVAAFVLQLVRIKSQLLRVVVQLQLVSLAEFCVCGEL